MYLMTKICGHCPTAEFHAVRSWADKGRYGTLGIYIYIYYRRYPYLVIISSVGHSLLWASHPWPQGVIQRPHNTVIALQMHPRIQKIPSANDLCQPKDITHYDTHYSTGNDDANGWQKQLDAGSFVRGNLYDGISTVNRRDFIFVCSFVGGISTFLK